MSALVDSRPAPAGLLRIGPHAIATPVVLAPMAGITNVAFRRLCRELAGQALREAGLGGAAANGAAANGAAANGAAVTGAAGAAVTGAGLYVSEMVTSRALVERSAESMRLIQHGLGEHPRSVQLYGVDPTTVGAAVRLLVDEDRADHVDLNFGCPVPKVTRKGGGAALPWKSTLFRDIVRAAVAAAAPAGVPVTVKMRKGVDDDHLTFVEAGRTAEDEGVAAVSLHGRTAAQHYSGRADWTAIGELKAAVTSIPVLGNGDVWSADDALAMVEQTGCDGVVVGRGCLGRPWLFADLAAAFAGRTVRVRPTLGQVAHAIRRHTELLAEHYDEQPAEYHRSRPSGRGVVPDGEAKACRDIRKHVAWYLKGFSVGQQLRSNLAMVESLAALDDLLAALDHDQQWPGDPAEGQRGRAGSPQRVALPERWLESRELVGESARMIREAELSVSGG